MYRTISDETSSRTNIRASFTFPGNLTECSALTKPEHQPKTRGKKKKWKKKHPFSNGARDFDESEIVVRTQNPRNQLQPCSCDLCESIKKKKKLLRNSVRRYFNYLSNLFAKPQKCSLPLPGATGRRSVRSAPPRARSFRSGSRRGTMSPVLDRDRSRSGNAHNCYVMWTFLYI